MDDQNSDNPTDQQDIEALEEDSAPVEGGLTEDGQAEDVDAGADSPQGLHLVDADLDLEITSENIIEAVLFTTDQPLSPAKIAGVIGHGAAGRQVRQMIERLNERYQQVGCSFRIEQIAGGYQMLTLPQYGPYLEQLHKVRGESRLSKAALETLAVIAYRQPATRAQVEAIRGVACGEVLRSLMDKGLIKIVGRAEELGRPMLYGTTRRFLEVFGLNSLQDLPQVEELQPPPPASSAAAEGPAERPATEEQTQIEQPQEKPQNGQP